MLVGPGQGPTAPLHTAPVDTVNEPFSTGVGVVGAEVWSAPAFAVGAGVMVRVTWSLTALQVPLPAEVKVSVTLPAVISAALGV